MKQTHDRFWSKVDLDGKDHFDCWEWKASITGRGYGQYWHNGRHVHAHRHAYFLNFGRLPSGRKSVIRHRCDNPLCVNPLHLIEGSQSDNALEGYRRGGRERMRGERHGLAKLTAEQVRAIRADTRSASMVAAEFGLHWSHVYKIRKGSSWGHIS